MMDQRMEISACFFAGYVKLLHIEAYLVQKILDPTVPPIELVLDHNIIEDAKARVVQAYLPFNVQTCSRDVNSEEK